MYVNSRGIVYDRFPASNFVFSLVYAHMFYRGRRPDLLPEPPKDDNGRPCVCDRGLASFFRENLTPNGFYNVFTSLYHPHSLNVLEYSKWQRNHFTFFFTDFDYNQWGNRITQRALAELNSGDILKAPLDDYHEAQLTAYTLMSLTFWTFPRWTFRFWRDISTFRVTKPFKQSVIF